MNATLEVKAQVYSGDELSTDATGRLRVWLNDDTTLSLSGDTLFKLEEYADAGADSRFKSSMTGLARLLTGRIVKQNPDGFSVSTPQATVGIRGTILSVQADANVTTVYVENTMNRVLVNGTTVPSGSKITVADGVAPSIVPMTPADRQMLGRDLAVYRGSPALGLSNGVRAAARQVPQPLADIVEAPAVAAFAEGLAAERREAQMRLIADLLTPSQGHITGTLTPDGGPWYNDSIKGSFAFDMDLKKGVISNAVMSMPQESYYEWSYVLAGGSGSISGSNFKVNGFTGTLFMSGMLYDNVLDSAWMQGEVARSGAAARVSGKYEVQFRLPYTYDRDRGNFSGGGTLR